MKKWILGTAIGVVVMVGGGTWYAYHAVQEKIGEQVVAILKDPATQNEINKITANLPQSVDSSMQSSISHAMIAHDSISNASKGNHSISSAMTRSHSVGSAIISSTSVGVPASSSPSAAHSGGTSKTAGDNGSSNHESIPIFTSREQIIAFAESHFTKSEILHYLELYEHRGSLTKAEKDEIKREILSHFTPAEIQAMAAAMKKYP
jgi:hypothetical protein